MTSRTRFVRGGFGELLCVVVPVLHVVRVAGAIIPCRMYARLRRCVLWCTRWERFRFEHIIIAQAERSPFIRYVSQTRARRFRVRYVCGDGRWDAGKKLWMSSTHATMALVGETDPAQITIDAILKVGAPCRRHPHDAGTAWHCSHLNDAPEYTIDRAQLALRACSLSVCCSCVYAWSDSVLACSCRRSPSRTLRSSFVLLRIKTPQMPRRRAKKARERALRTRVGKKSVSNV